MSNPIIRTSASCAVDPTTAAAELHVGLAMSDAAITVFFASPSYDRDALTAALNAQFGTTPVIGCTTAGEIGPLGYLQNSLSGFSLGKTEFRASALRLDSLDHFELGGAESAVHAALAELSCGAMPPTAADTFGFLMIDGLSMREEVVTCALSNTLNDIQIFGGSAGDGLNFRSTHIFHEGRFHSNSALLTLICTQRPFKVFQTQHFSKLGQKLVVTDADSAHRLVREINGERAAAEYAASVGVAPDALGPNVFALHPVVVNINGKPYVRSIQKANPDGSLSFYCAIDVGVVLTVASGDDIILNFKKALAEVEHEVPSPQLIVGCDCILRNLEFDQQGMKAQIAEIMASRHVVGFSTYGEQLNSVHMNQTFTGVAIG